MKSKKFLRRNTLKFSKLGKNRKKIQRWKRAKGRDAKIRLKMKGYPSAPTVGYKSPRKESGKIKGKIPLLVHNIKDIERADKNNIVIIAKVGAKKKFDLIKKAEEMKLFVYNLAKQGGKNESK